MPCSEPRMSTESELLQGQVNKLTEYLCCILSRMELGKPPNLDFRSSYSFTETLGEWWEDHKKNDKQLSLWLQEQKRPDLISSQNMAAENEFSKASESQDKEDS